MITFHVYKANCYKSSRVMLQAKWDEQSFFVHNVDLNNNSKLIPEKSLCYKNIYGLLNDQRYGEKQCWVIHAQSGLVYMWYIFFLRLFKRKNAVNIVYDIHDLLEFNGSQLSGLKLLYSVFRYKVFEFMERLAFSQEGIHTMTVSKGIAEILVERYSVKEVSVVYSAMSPIYVPEDFYAMRRYDNVLLFFGTPERFPSELIDVIGDAGLELHIYGRFGEKNNISELSGCKYPDFVKYFGEYSPDDMSFLKKYKYLILYKPNDKKNNFRYSLPNKFFQSMAYAVSIVLSNNFEEMQDLLGLKGGVKVLDDPNNLKEVLSVLRFERNEEYIDEVSNLLSFLHNKSKKKYENITQVFI